MSAQHPVRSRIVGVGKYLPAKRVTNKDLETQFDTSDEWIVQRTGIHARHIAAEGEFTSDLATQAARAALAHAGLTIDTIDMIVVATTSPDYTFPSTATLVQHKLGMTRGFAFDVQAVCSGFVYALSVADNFIKTGQVKTALVIAAETFSRLVDWNDRTTAVLFGDGAGAVVLRGEAGTRGILSCHLYSDGQYADLLRSSGGPSRDKSVGVCLMNGREVFRHAVAKMADAVEVALRTHTLTGDDVDWLIPHQANRRIIDTMGEKLGLPADRIVITLAEQANTSAATIPLALATAVEDGRIKPDHLLLIEALGAGFTWGSALIRY